MATKYIVNGQKTWTTLGQHGDWIFCLVRTSTEGKPQTGISFLLVDMKSPGVAVRPIVLLDSEPEVNEVFDNVEVPAENLVGRENKGWNYAKYLLAHERTGLPTSTAPTRRLRAPEAHRQRPRVYDEPRLPDEIARLEVDIVALEMMVLRVLAAERAASSRFEIADLLKIRGSRSSSRYTELMMLAAAGSFSVPSSTMRWRPAGRATTSAPRTARRSPQLLQRTQDDDLRRQQRVNATSSPVAAGSEHRDASTMDFDFTDDQQSLRDAVIYKWVEGLRRRRRRAIVRAGGFDRGRGARSPSSGCQPGTARSHGGMVPVRSRRWS